MESRNATRSANGQIDKLAWPLSSLIKVLEFASAKYVKEAVMPIARSLEQQGTEVATAIFVA